MTPRPTRQLLDPRRSRSSVPERDDARRAFIRPPASTSRSPRSKIALVLGLALFVTSIAPATAIAAEPTVTELVGKLKDCERMECATLVALTKRGPTIWPELAVGLDAKDEMTRFWTLGVLSEVPVPEAQPQLVALLEFDPQVRIRAASAFALGSQRKGDVVAPLVKALADSDVNVRFEAASALANHPDKRAVKPLMKLLRSPDADVRRAAVEALGRTRDPQPTKRLLLRLSRDGDPAVRGTTAIALAQIGAASAVAPLIARLAKERDTTALAAAAYALGALGAEEALPELQRLSSHKEPTVSKHAKDAVAAIQAAGKKKASSAPAKK